MGIGAYSTVSKKFFKGINEQNHNLARKKLHKIIGYDAYKWRWKFKPVPDKVLESWKKGK